MMNKPTKKQLVDCVTHYADGIREVVSGNTVLNTVEEYKEFLENLLSRAPSLEPVPPKTSFPVLTDPDQVEDPEAPAVH